MEYQANGWNQTGWIKGKPPAWYFDCLVVCDGFITIGRYDMGTRMVLTAFGWEEAINNLEIMYYMRLPDRPLDGQMIK